MDLNSVLTILAQGGTGGGGGGGGFMQMIPMLLLMGGVFYIAFIRPQKRKQKEHQDLVSSLKAGDQIITIGGIHGTVHNVKKDTIVLKVDEKAKIEMAMGSISKVVKADDAKDDEKK